MSIQLEDNPPTIKKNERTDEQTTEGGTPGQSFGAPLKGHRAIPLGQGRAVEMAVEIGPLFKPRRLQTPLDKIIRHSSGKRSFTHTDRKRGRYVQSRPAHGQHDDIAFDATFRQAAPYQRRRHEDMALKGEPEVAIAIAKEDLQRKVRVRRASNLILFVVDASWSMAAAERMVATKGAIMSLLIDAYQRRDRVGLVTFQKDRARVVLPFTSSVELAQKALKDIPVGGKTPLSSGLMLAYRLFVREMRLHTEVLPLMILLTDGAGNVSMGEMAAHDEALMVAEMIRGRGIRSVVMNMEHVSFDRGLAQELAEALNGPCYTLRELKAKALYQTVRDELQQ